MAKSRLLYQADQELLGKHLRSGEWVLCTGKLKIYERESKPVVLQVTNEVYDSFLSEGMEDKKRFAGNSVAEVFGRFSKWYFRHGIVFQD